MGKIYAVILTYNRKELLEECLAAVQAQSHRCDAIIVIDNGSTDGTAELIQSEYPAVELCRLAENSGAAGGFNMGMRVAVAAGAEFAWVMDDDVIPQTDALEQLVAAFDFLEGNEIAPPFVISTARAPGGELTNIPSLDRSANSLQYENWAMFLDRGIVPVRRATFVSILIPRETFRTHGYPIASMFIWGEDTEFTTRVTRNEPGFLCGLSKVTHVRAIAGRPDIRSENAPHRIVWHKYFIRNGIYTQRRYGRKRMVARSIRTHLLGALRLSLRGDLYKAMIVLRGVGAGLFFRADDDLRSISPMEVRTAFFSRSLHTRMQEAAGRSRTRVEPTRELREGSQANSARFDAAGEMTT